MQNNDYLNDPDVAGFCKFMEMILSEREGVFFHSYKDAKSKKIVEFNSFSKAFYEYSWGKEGERDYEFNYKKLKELQQLLESSLKEKNELNCLISALKILEWGGVYRGSVGWLAYKAGEGRLVSSISEARDILSKNDLREAKAFGRDKRQLRSDSGTTKIYALAGTGGRSIIYDDRVGAALALFVKAYLIKAGKNSVPESLNFMCGTKKSGRNPSDENYRFSKKITGELHALSNLKANIIIEALALKEENFSKWEDSTYLNGTADKMHAIEAALFMIGYAVAGDRVEKSMFQR